MPEKSRKDSISISFEVKYISHGGGIGKPDELVQYPAPDVVRGKVQKLLQVVRDKKTEIKEAVFDRIELNLQSIDVNILKVTNPEVIASSAQIFMKEMMERERYVHNCMTEAESCCCFETSKPRFLEKELREFDECLESFNRILLANTHDVEAKNSVKKTQSGTGDSSRKIPEKIVKFSEVNSLPSAPAAQEKQKELARSNAMPKTSEKNSSSVNKTANSDQSIYDISPEVKGLTENHQSSNPTQRKEVKPQNAAHLGVSSNFTHSGISSKTSRDVQPSNSIHSGISSNTSRDVQPSNLIHSGISSNTSRDVQPSSLIHSGIPLNTSTDVKPDNSSHSGISSNTSRDVKPSNFTHSSISLNTPREPNKESNSASVAPLKPSGDRGSSATDLEKDSAKMPKLKEIEQIQLQTKPAPARNSNLESIQLQNYPAWSERKPQQQIKPTPPPNSKKEPIQLQNYPVRSEIQPVQQQIKPAPPPNSKKEPIQLQNYPVWSEIQSVQQQNKPAPPPNLKKEPIQQQNYPLWSEIQPVQQQIKPAPAPNSKKESIQLQNYPRFEAEVEPVQQQIKPAAVKNLKTDPPEVEIEPIQPKNYPIYQGRGFQ